jgi:Type I phosphodiesterase / nucleotide pyrophosphatase
MPRVARLLRHGRFRLHRVPASLPTSTPAYQAAVMYGGPVDVPAFEFVDKRTGTYRWFPRPWDAAAVEAAHARGRRGIVTGGRTYGAIFGGGAEDAVLTFARLLRPSPVWGRLGFRARVLPALVLLWVALRMSVVSVAEILRWLGLVLRDFSLGRVVPSPLPPLLRLVVSGWLRELFTLGVTLDVYGGVPALYVNFVDYDVNAHALGPEHPAALRALRAVDASIGAIARVVARLPERGYDLYVVSDHGQLGSVPFRSVSGGVSIVDVVVAAFGPDRQRSQTPEPALAAGEPLAPIRMPLWPFAPVWQRNLAYLEQRLRERNAVWVGGLCIVPAGPNVNIYLTHTLDRVLVEEIESRYPGTLIRLSMHPGIGYVLARDAAGPVCYHRGAVHRIPPPPGATACPVFDRPDRASVVLGFQDLLAMPSGGDVILYGHDTEAGCVSYLDELGSHAGPSLAELYPFVIAPSEVAFDFRAVRRPRDLYPLFVRYQERGAVAGLPLPPEGPGGPGGACRTLPPVGQRGTGGAGGPE